MEKALEPLLNDKSAVGPSEDRREPTYWRTATARIKTEVAIQRTDQNSAGIPVAFAIFTASVGTVVTNSDERKKTVLRSSNAFSTHWTARKLTKKVATRADAKRATANNPAEIIRPAASVNGRPPSVPQVPAMIGFTTPKMVVSTNTTPAEPTRTRRAATDRRISSSNSAPYVIAPK